LSLKYRSTPHTIFREIDGQVITLNLHSGVYFAMNEVGTRIWHLLMGGTSKSDIVNAIKNEYDVPIVQLNKDLDSFLMELQESDLIEEF